MSTKEYKNPFIYSRDSSVSDIYSYVDLTKYIPIYGSSINFNSRINILSTYDNSLKIIPASENNLTIKYYLKFILNNKDTGDLLKTIEIAGGVKYLKFKSPTLYYQDFIGLVEDYSVSKNNNSNNYVDIVVSCYIKAPDFNWNSTSILNNNNIKNKYAESGFSFGSIGYSLRRYSKYDCIYIKKEEIDYLQSMQDTLIESPSSTQEDILKYKNEGIKYSQIFSKNLSDNFWYAKENIPANSVFNIKQWSKNFIYENKIPFSIKNKFDLYQFNAKNSLLQNIKSKENSNSLKEFELKFENISDTQCISMLFFLEKKCGYKRFIYDFPIFLKSNKVFICPKWDHNLKYYNCNDLTLTFVEDPNPNIKAIQSLTESNYYYTLI